MRNREIFRNMYLRKKLKSHTKNPPIHNFLYCWTEIMSNIENLFKNSRILYFHPSKTGQKTKNKCIFSRFFTDFRQQNIKIVELNTKSK